LLCHGKHVDMNRNMSAIEYDTRLVPVYEESPEFRYPCAAMEEQSCNT